MNLYRHMKTIDRKWVRDFYAIPIPPLMTQENFVTLTVRNPRPKQLLKVLHAYYILHSNEYDRQRI